MTVFEQLLQVQDHDTHLDQLHHRRETLPERADLAARRRALAAFVAETDELQGERDGLGREQRRVEDEVASIQAKVTEVDTKLYSGTVTSPRELQGFQDDLDALRRRQRQLEDEVLGFMEQIEPLDEKLVARAATTTELEAGVEQVREALAAAETDLDGELAAAEHDRATAAEPVPADLLDRYEHLRKQYDGVAIARLVGTNCGGCHLSLSAVEVDRIRHEPPDVVIHCEECGRLLVR